MMMEAVGRMANAGQRLLIFAVLATMPGGCVAYDVARLAWQITNAGPGECYRNGEMVRCR